MPSTQRRNTRRNRKGGRTATSTKPANTAPALTAAMVLQADHPLHKTFARWVEKRAAEVGGDEKLTVRKARKFLAAHPFYRKSAEAAATKAA